MDASVCFCSATGPRGISQLCELFVTGTSDVGGLWWGLVKLGGKLIFLSERVHPNSLEYVMSVGACANSNGISVAAAVEVHGLLRPPYMCPPEAAELSQCCHLL